ncbi:MAG: HdeD family acid-resistance protein [Planctomycetota bacterium]
MAESTRAHPPTILGAIAITLGILALLAPGLAGMSVALLLGVLLIIGGVTRFGWALRAQSVGRGALLFILGGLMALGGVALLLRPLLAAGVMTITLAVYFILDGVLEIIVALRAHTATEGWGWLMFSGIVSILLGVMLWSQFPLSGIWAMGILVGIKLIFTGITMIASGAERPMPRAA